MDFVSSSGLGDNSHISSRLAGEVEASSSATACLDPIACVMEACEVALQAMVACIPSADKVKVGSIRLDMACVEILDLEVLVRLCGKQGDGRVMHVLDAQMVNQGSAPSSSWGATVAFQDEDLGT